MHKLFASLIATFLLVPALAFAQPALAASPTEELCKGSGGTLSGGSCQPKEGKKLAGQSGYFGDIVDTLIFVAGAISVIILIIGGIGYVTSTGDPARIKKAKDTILYAVVGLIITILAFAIVNFVIGEL